VIRQLKHVAWENVPPGAGDSVKTITREARKLGILSCPYHYIIKRDGIVEVGRSILKPAGIHCSDDAINASDLILIGLIAPTTPRQIIVLDKLMLAIVRLFPGIQLKTK